MTELESVLNDLPVGWNTGFDEDSATAILRAALHAAQPRGPVALSGVYFLFNALEVVYIGQSRNVLSRIGTHMAEGIKQFDTFTIIRVDPEHRIMRERQLIRTFKPYYNNISYREQGFMPAKEVAEILGVTEYHIRHLIKLYKIPWVFGSGGHCDTKPEFFKPYLESADTGNPVTVIERWPNAGKLNFDEPTPND